MPFFMKDLEFYHPGLKTYSMSIPSSERKEMLRKGSDAACGFAGRWGTLEEFLETFTLKGWDCMTSNCTTEYQGFYQELIALFEKYEREGFWVRAGGDS